MVVTAATEIIFERFTVLAPDTYMRITSFINPFVKQFIQNTF